MDFGGLDYLPPRVISSGGRFGPYAELRWQGLGNAAYASATWPSASLALYVPITIPFSYPVKRVFWVNGATATGNIDFGIYSTDGAQIYHTGNTAQSGVTAPQYVTPGTDLMLAPGAYFFALVSSSASSTMARVSPGANGSRLGGMCQQASASPLPATATFAAVANGYLPLYGVTLDTTGF